MLRMARLYTKKCPICGISHTGDPARDCQIHAVLPHQDADSTQHQARNSRKKTYHRPDLTRSILEEPESVFLDRNLIR